MAEIKCPNCCNCYHETTEKFDSDVSPNGSMVRLRDPWRKWGWCSFGDGEDGRDTPVAETDCTLASDMLCPGCGSPLAPSGRLIIIEEQDPEATESEEGNKRELVALMVAEGKSWKEMLKESGMSFKVLSSLIKENQ